MSRADAAESRARILAAALELFGSRGYQATSMREISERLGFTKAALYYHFTSKAEILSSLVSPLLDQLDGAVEQAAAQPDLTATRRRFLEGVLDAMFAHRAALTLLFRDTSVYSEDSLDVATRVLAWAKRASDLLAGPSAGWQQQVRVAQAIAAVGDPITLFPMGTVPDEELRSELLHGAGLLLGLDYPSTAPANH